MNKLEIIYTKQAIKQINTLDKWLKQRIKIGIEKLPFGDIKKLKGSKYSFRLRIGDYRVLYNLNGDIIEIIAVLPRREAYKNL